MKLFEKLSETYLKKYFIGKEIPWNHLIQQREVFMTY